MEASSLATAGVQPGDTSKVRVLADRLTKLTQLRIVDRLIGVLEASRRAEVSVCGCTSVDDRALQIHRARRAALAHELGL